MGNLSISDVKPKADSGFGATLPDSTPAPAVADFPRSRLPVAPPLSMASFRRGGGPHVPAILDAGAARLVTSGRVAIALALRQMGVGAGDTVLVPSYHCASMVEPVIWSGATPVFYRINPDTSVKLDDVAAKLDGRAKVLMATNYFGFPQDLAALRAFCDARGLLLLEDCAHSFLGEYKGKPLGSYGDYAIASSMKFFPIYEGGCLVSARHALDQVALQSAGMGFEAKVLINTLEEGFAYNRLRLLKALCWLPMTVKNLLWRQIKARRHTSAQSMAPGSSDGGFGFDPRWLDKRSSFFARAMLKLVSRTRMGALRRRNYLRLQQALDGLPGCRPLHPVLPDGVYPWVFPLLTDDPHAIFGTLKMAGVPVIRFGEYLWPGVDAGVCATSVDLSRRVLQFPCHQELTEQEMEWMVDHIRNALLAQKAPPL
ncbi:aminotransferase class I/II-fold pyridoxal phosphate-dependent enzyme [Massilia sp. YIM B04103]|uniref:aminotransferase class I/II-fold pyridoxal phosphate-dependent enzyme n=1 Tax=Massilia sp. YIM B04103 TaxID=2963106 RepID=UPI00210C0790|nr:aminotransferase class I/II-fold pyridoxal phosphate-dependent enzyme [Massilia sp. YIM B04103]